uniref:BAH domain-containing protein n=1 Tax=Timema bartmani TaxID=61472 RepID=A0A7R9EZZ1_9NEOP|nr:unnamed protein product [Timema bartmani]
MRRVLQNRQNGGAYGFRPDSRSVLQPQCEDRVANGMAPWAATNHNPALTPPTLWQYPASVPLQLGPTEHLPLPPVGYQLVRDPLSGQLLLLPTTNIEHLQRTVLWPSYPTTLQPSLHMTTATTQPAAQHIQLFEEPAEFSGGARILVQPHLTITTTTTAPPPPPLADKRGSVGKAAIIKLEDCGGGSIVDSSTAIVKAHQVTPQVPVMPTRQVDVSVGTNTTCTQVFSSATTTVTPVTHYFYEHPTAVVQLAQTPQPSASVQTDSGKRSQATSPVNPAETCLTPPPEVVVSQSESDDTNTSSAVASASNENQVQVQDASNQTDTPPVSEDENTESSNSKELNQEPPQAKEAECSPPQLVPSVQAPENVQESKPVVEDVAPTYAKPSNQPVDLSGLELLSNSIEEFESHLGSSDMSNSKYVDTRTPTASIEETGVVSVPESSLNLPTTNSDDSLQEGDSRPSAEEAAETLQLLCQQSAQLKKLEVVSTNVLEPQCCDKPLTETCDRASDVDNKHEEAKTAESDSLLATNESSPLGGLGLLCALAEQRFMEEVASSGSRLSRKVPLSKSAKTSEKTLGSSQATVASGVDVNRNYKTRESEQECKKFIANKVLQYYQNGNRSGSSSPQHTVQHTLMAGVCTSPLQAELMDAMELEMRMRLAELQRKYREKQKELLKLTPRKPGSDAGSTSAVMSPDGSSNGSGSHPVKRGPGRPRKKVSKLMLDSPPVSPPSENQNISSHSRSKSSRLSGSKAKDSSSSSNRELPPPVLEKVTELTRPRSRLDSDDCAAPKLKASKLDILKPPTLTANKILSSAKFKPASSNALTSCNVASRGLKLPQCNVNLVKLASGQSKVKEPTHSKNVKSGAVHSPPDSSRSSHCLLSSMDSAASLDKLSAFPSGRLSLGHAASHTFGSKPPSRLPSPGESESLFWFKSSDKSSFGKLSERLSPVNENQKHPLSITESPPGLSSALQSVPSSSKKRKVGRPKKHLAVTGSELTTEMIVSKKPKSKSSLVGLLLSKNRHSAGHTSFNKPAIQSVSTNLYNTSLEGSISNNPCNFKGVTASGIFKTTAGNVGPKGKASGPLKKGTVVLVDSSISDEPKPNKIRPKLKAEAKVKSWLWCEDEDAVALDWPTSTEVTKPLTRAPAHGWTKKMEKQTEKLVTKNTTEAVNRPQKRKTVTNSESGPTVTPPKIATPSTKVSNALAKIPKKTTIATATSKPASTPIRKSVPTPTSKSTSTAPAKPKVLQKEKRANSNEKRPTIVEETPSNATKKRASATEEISTNIAKKRAASVEETSANVTKKRVTLMDETPVNPSKKHKRNSSCGHSSGGTSESDDIPLSILSKHTPASCILTETHLNTDKQRALTVMGGLFYAGTISAIRAPDVYGITLDGERGNRPHIFSREEILKDAILEVKPAHISTVVPGTRVCAYWSQQYRCLYPGTVALPSSPNPELDSQFVSVEFDDEDNGRINIDDIRLLPADYPIVEYDPNPLLTLGKRRRRNSGASCDSKDRKTSVEGRNQNTNLTNASTTKDTAEDNQQAGPAEPGQESNAASKTKKGSPPSTRTHSPAGQGKTSPLPRSCEGANEEADKTEDGRNKTELVDLSNRERKRLKKRRREKLKRLLSCSGDSSAKKRHRKHRCGDEHCKHKRHHRRHRKHRHRHGSRNKDSSSGGSSGESGSKTSGDADLARLSPVLEQLDILEIQQKAIRQLQSRNEQSPAELTTVTTEDKRPVNDRGKTGEEEEGRDRVPPAETEPAITEPKKSKVDTDTGDITSREKETAKAKKGRDRQPSVESRSKMAAFLPARQLWGWSGRGFKRPGGKGRGKKEFFKAIQRGKETIMVGDCAVFLSTGRPDRPYIGRIESMWESWGTNMVVRVKWFYHPEETIGCPTSLKYPGALFESPHVDENDVQTISHKCEVLPLDGYTERLGSEPHRYSTIYDNNDIYYLAGYYDPTSNHLTMEPGVA